MKWTALAAVREQVIVRFDEIKSKGWIQNNHNIFVVP